MPLVIELLNSENILIDKKIKNTIKRGIKFVLFIGEEELVSKEFKVKDLETGEEIKDEIMAIAMILTAQRWSGDTDEED
jgi:histidyl-tRNA synthetase